jgi:hypothetical protein
MWTVGSGAAVAVFAQCDHWWTQYKQLYELQKVHPNATMHFTMLGTKDERYFILILIGIAVVLYYMSGFLASIFARAFDHSMTAHITPTALEGSYSKRELDYISRVKRRTSGGG